MGLLDRLRSLLSSTPEATPPLATPRIHAIHREPEPTPVAVDEEAPLRQPAETTASDGRTAAMKAAPDEVLLP